MTPGREGACALGAPRAGGAARPRPSLVLYDDLSVNLKPFRWQRAKADAGAKAEVEAKAEIEVKAIVEATADVEAKNLHTNYGEPSVSTNSWIFNGFVVFERNFLVLLWNEPPL